ncbi:hypothetical protein B0H17DRAFT_1060808 [Mycena rosella]|uniref:Uncharacterized protein n=1 Tax=Mycena rosella TaxID=1033263 RepID=A0AAD7DML8_MYCRO|nr:hypothetical protein B0H17DRAFT_1060808 [Mycena rosella]
MDIKTVLNLMSLWRPTTPIVIPISIIEFFNHLNVEDLGVHEFIIPPTLAQSHDSQDTLTALWNLASLDIDMDLSLRGGGNTAEARILGIYVRLEMNSSKRARDQYSRTAIEQLLTTHIHHIFPGEETTKISDESDDTSAYENVWAWSTQARFNIIVEFLEQWSLDPLPYNTVETFRKINLFSVENADIPLTIQIRLAESTCKIFTSGFKELMKAIVKSRVWYAYTYTEDPQSSLWGHPWLVDPTARHQIKETFTAYLEELKSARDSPGDPDFLTQLEKILHGLDFRHPEHHEPGSGDIIGGNTSSSGAGRENSRAAGGQIEDEDRSGIPNENV